MSLSDDVLIMLLDYSGGYKLMRKRLRYNTTYVPYEQIQKNNREVKDAVLRSTLSRLRSKGLIRNQSSIWDITNKGRKYIQEKASSKFPHFKHAQQKNKKKEVVIIFDIPERKRRTRDWLRRELTALGFSAIQKSVWLGPAPLPPVFIHYLNDADILGYLKFFEARRENIV